MFSLKMLLKGICEIKLGHWITWKIYVSFDIFILFISEYMNISKLKFHKSGVNYAFHLVSDTKISRTLKIQLYFYLTKSYIFQQS